MTSTTHTDILRIETKVEGEGSRVRPRFWGNKMGEERNEALWKNLGISYPSSKYCRKYGDNIYESTF